MSRTGWTAVTVLLSVAPIASALGCGATRPTPLARVARSALIQAAFNWKLPPVGIQKPTVEIEIGGRRETVPLVEISNPGFDGPIEWLRGASDRLGVVTRAVRTSRELRAVHFLPDGFINSQVIRDGEVVSEFRQNASTTILCLINSAQEIERGDPTAPRRMNFVGDREIRGGNGIGGLHTTYTIAPILTGRLAAAIAGTGSNIARKDLEIFTFALINAANEILERELAVTLQPVAVDNAYPIDANQNNVIGSAEGLAEEAAKIVPAGKADLAHLIASGAGGGSGWAAIGSTCGADSTKAATIGSGINHGLYLDTFVHEVGHQLGAHHSFNDGPGRSAYNSGYEPGAGTSVMTHNVRFRTFHAASLTQMFTYLNGQTCGTRTAIPTPPGLRAMPTTPLLVPVSTAFSLDAEPAAAATCARIDGFDPGAAEKSSPPFFAADTGCEAVRFFPDEPRQIDLAALPSQVPSAKLTLHFRAVAWSGTTGRRPLASSDINVEFVDTTPFAISTLSPACNFAAGTKVHLNWDGTGITGPRFNASTLLAEIVYADRSEAPRVLARDLDIGTKPVALDLPAATGRARIKLTPTGSIFFAVSDWFTVLPATACTTL